jgi:hypothetical protein
MCLDPTRNTDVTQADLDYRTQIMRDVQSNLIDLNEDFLYYIDENKWSLFFSRKVFQFRSTRKFMRAFNKECTEIFEASLLKDVDQDGKRDLLFAFNDLLELYKPHFIFMESTKPSFNRELPDDLFNIITYGGKI